MIKETFVLEFIDEKAKEEFSQAIKNCGGEYRWAYVLVPVPHKYYGWRHPNVHRVPLRPVQED